MLAPTILSPTRVAFTCANQRHHLAGVAQIKHEDFMEGINVVSAKKKGSLDYYA